MKEKTIQKTVYIAQDGKEFLNKKECEKYEKEYLDKIKFFSICYNFDYNEGRGFQSIVHVAVIPSGYDVAEVIALHFSKYFGMLITEAKYGDMVDHRRNGVAQHLLQLAEQQAKLSGVKTIGLEFNKEESETFVLKWYLKNGYKPFSKKSNLLIKELKD